MLVRVVRIKLEGSSMEKEIYWINWWRRKV